MFQTSLPVSPAPVFHQQPCCPFNLVPWRFPALFHKAVRKNDNPPFFKRTEDSYLIRFELVNPLTVQLLELFLIDGRTEISRPPEERYNLFLIGPFEAIDKLLNQTDAVNGNGINPVTVTMKKTFYPDTLHQFTFKLTVMSTMNRLI